MNSADAVRSLVREVLFGEAADDGSQNGSGSIGPSPLEKIRATGEPVSFKSDIPKIKSVVAKIQSSPAYQVGMSAWSGGLVGAAQTAGMRVPRALSRPGEFLTRPEVSTVITTVFPGAGSAMTAGRGLLGAVTKGIGSEISGPVGAAYKAAKSAPAAIIKADRYVPTLDPVAWYSTPTSLVTAPLSGKDPLKR